MYFFIFSHYQYDLTDLREVFKEMEWRIFGKMKVKDKIKV